MKTYLNNVAYGVSLGLIFLPLGGIVVAVLYIVGISIENTTSRLEAFNKKHT